MKTKKIAAVLLAMILVLSLVGCGAAKKEADAGYPQDISFLADSSRAGNSYSQKPAESLEWSLSPSYASKDGSEGLSSVASKTGSVFPSEVKLIYRANAEAQTEKFDDAEQKLKAAVADAGGYFESQNLYSGGYYNSGALRRGEYIVRIPAEKYRDFVDAMGGWAVVTSLKESVEDVGQTYHETEVRLKTLYAKEERLQELLRKASDLNDIIQLENALSDTEYQIDMYGSVLNRYDSLISFATVTITLQEVSRPDAGIGEKNGFFATLCRHFVSGLGDTLEALENFIYWISENFIALGVCVGVFFFLRSKHLIRKIRDKIAVRKENKENK